MAFLWAGPNIGWSVIHTCSTIPESNGEVVFGIVFGVSVASFILCLWTLLAMWRNQTFVTYLYWHLVWILLTFATYSFISFAHVLSWFGIFDCRLIYVPSTQMAMLIGASSGLVPGVIRLTDTDMRERVINSIFMIIVRRKPKPLHCENSNTSDSSLRNSFLRVDEHMPISSMSGRNYAGLFKSLAAKVPTRQFIIDSLISLSIVQKLNSGKHSIVGVEV
jgi:hypothetical protein